MRKVIQLVSKSNFVLSDVVNSPYFGPDGAGGITLGTNPPGLPMWDFSQFDEVHWSIYCGGYAGATALQPIIYGYDTFAHPGFSKNSFSCSGFTIGTSGGGHEAVLSTTRNPYATSGAAGISGGPLLITAKPNFAQLQLLVTGTMSALTSLRMSIYGVYVHGGT